MKKSNLLLFPVIIFLPFFLFACGSSSGDDGGDSESSAEWTYMVYMGADNDLADYGMEDINEMEKVGSTDKVNIVVQAEFSPLEIEDVTTDTLRFHIRKDNDPDSIRFDTATAINNVDMADPASLTDFIAWARKKYPAKHYALVLWSHGGGWKDKNADNNVYSVRGAIQDDTSDTAMSLPDIATAVRNSGVYFDLINFDACLMGMYEVAYELKDLTDYMVFSEAGIPGSGYPYDSILADLIAEPDMDPHTLALITAIKYHEFYADLQRGSTTISAIDMGKIERLHDKLTELAEALINDTTGIDAVVSDAQQYTQQFDYPWYHDIYDFCAYLESNSANPTIYSLCREIRDTISSIVFGNFVFGYNTDFSECHGLSIYLPTASETNSVETEAYGELASNQPENSSGSTWKDFIEHHSLLAGGWIMELQWTDPYGNYCDSDLDLIVIEPSGKAYSTRDDSEYTPNGHFSADSVNSGESLEYYIANDDIEAGNYHFVVGYYSNGLMCNDAIAYLYFTPADGETSLVDFEQLNRFNPASNNGCRPDDLLCAVDYSDFWHAQYIKVNTRTWNLPIYKLPAGQLQKGMRLDITLDKKKGVALTRSGGEEEEMD